jgi:hypothetical protein
MMSAVNSDAPGELLIALCVYQAAIADRRSHQRAVDVGRHLGRLLTKATVYYTVACCGRGAHLHTRHHASRNSEASGRTRRARLLARLTSGALF